MIPGARPPNFRDVGEALGLWLDPSPIPEGRLLRGGKFDTLTNLEDLGNPRTILNLRRGPDPVHLHGARIVHVPAADGLENYDTRQRQVRDWLTKALRVLASAELPVYVHCTSGRDRTGIVVAAALVLIGVPPAIAIEEYLLSDGADLASIELAMVGILEARAGLALDERALRATLGHVG